MAVSEKTPSRRNLVGYGRHMRQEPQKSQRFKWLALTCAGLLLFVVAVAGVSVLRLRSNVQTASLNLGNYANGDLKDGPLDILVIGSDTRSGNNSAYGDESDRNSNARSDVMMLVQVSEDKQDVSVLSFPRDLMVDMPECTDPETGDVYPASQNTQINESLSHGGPGCTVATISSITGVNIDHFMLADFNAVKSLSSVVGGVEVCVTEPIDDSYSGLKLPAGNSTVEGEQALSFLRSRHGFGDGSDTSRIAAQQSFLASLLRKVKAEGTLTNPSGLMNIAEAVTQNVTVDQGLTNPATLANIGSLFSDVELNKVVFATVPNEPYELDQNKLQLADSADEVFAKLQNDQSLAEPQAEDPAPSAEASSSDTATPGESASPTAVETNFNVPVSLLNASGAENRAEDLAGTVKDAGFSQVNTEDSAVEYSASAVYYPAGYEAEAQAVADALGISDVQLSTAYSSVTAVIGQDFTEGNSLEQQTNAIAGNANGQTADQVTCQQSFEY